MNLIDEKVRHEHFGKGSIISQEDSIIEIQFKSEVKKFVYPDAFEKFLEIDNQKIADSIKEDIQIKLKEKQEEELQREEDRKQHRLEQQLRVEHEKLMRNHKLHPESQLAIWCDEEDQKDIFNNWKIFYDVYKSGQNKGKPKKPSRVNPNTVCLLTARDETMEEKDRYIIGAYMVKEDFIGKLCEDGYIPAHSLYKLQLTEDESTKIPFWKYYFDEKSPDKVTWNSGRVRYFNNEWMAQILHDIVALRQDTNEHGLAKDFFEHFCKMNRIVTENLSEPNGKLVHQ